MLRCLQLAKPLNGTRGEKDRFIYVSELPDVENLSLCGFFLDNRSHLQSLDNDDRIHLLVMSPIYIPMRSTSSVFNGVKSLCDYGRLVFVKSRSHFLDTWLEVVID